MEIQIPAGVQGLEELVVQFDDTAARYGSGLVEVTCRSTLVEVDRRRLVFDLVASDEAGEIGKGRHERFVIDTKKFMEKL